MNGGEHGRRDHRMNAPAARVFPGPFPLAGARAVLAPVLLGLLAAALPAWAHGAGLPVRILNPMHWPVLFAGLACGWRTGFAVGAAAPALSFLMSGYPLPFMIPPITLEMAAYGGMAGWLHGLRRLHPALCVAGAVVFGRILFIGCAWLAHVGAGDFGGYLRAALVPGIACALAQVALLPLPLRWMKR